ncbi:MAG: GtrA family protein [Anaerolineae bacterium]
MIAIFTGVANRFGINPKEAERFFKFAVVGVIGFVVDFGFFNLLLNPFTTWLADGTGLHQLLAGWGLSAGRIVNMPGTFASTVSFIMAIISNFLWNRYWTYPDSRSRSVRRQLTQFTVVSVAGIVIRVPIITFTAPPFTHLVTNIDGLAGYADRIGNNLALVVAVIVVMFWNFFVNRYWTYNDVE